DRLRELRRLTAGNQVQQQRLDALEKLIAVRNRELKETIDLRKKDDPKAPFDPKTARGLDEALVIVRTDRGKDLMDQVRAAVDEMKTTENQLLEERKQSEAASILVARWTIILGSLLAVVCVSIVAVRITHSLTRPLGQLTEASRQVASGNLKE